MSGRRARTYDPTNAQWVVDVTFKGNDFGRQDRHDRYVDKNIAIELDGVVQSAPDDQSGHHAAATCRSAATSARARPRPRARVALRRAARPVRPEKQTVQSVSPTLGKDQLTAGIVAGLIGLALVALYMLLFYRLLGLVVWFGLVLTGMVFFTLVSTCRASQGLTLTLAGVTGIIVSVGVTVDSYVVYFERLKDEVRTGKTVRSSLEPGFRQRVPHDHRRRPGVAARCRRALRVRDELGAGLRVLPRVCRR